MIKLIGCLDKRLQGQQISSAAVATELSHQYFPVVERPCCGKKQMRCVLKSTSRQNKEVITGSGMTAVTVFPQYRFSCDSCSLKKYVLLTTDLEIDHSPYSMDSLFSIMLEKKVYHLSNRNLQDKYGMSRSAFMNWTQKFSHDYILLKTFLPDQATDEDILSGKVPLSHAMLCFFIYSGRFFLHERNDFSIAVMPTNIVYKTVVSIKRSNRAI